MHKIFAIVVVYQPNENQLFKLIEVLQAQVDKVIVVDNGSADNCQLKLEVAANHYGVYINLGDNLGIAHALNIGIDNAQKNHADYVVSFDQDSLPEVGMVPMLLTALLEKIELGIKVAAVGPQYIDAKGKTVSPVRRSGLSLKQVPCEANRVFEVDHLISSGCLMNMQSLMDVGCMEKNLFIDYVDVVWSLRAQSKGYLLFGVCGAFMRHEMGDNQVNQIGFTANVHSPLRNYYMIRNGIWLLRQPWLGITRKLTEFFKLFKKYIVYSLFIGRNRQNIKMMTIGIWHALIGKMGKYEQ